MKNLINSLSVLVLAIIGITTFSSCDPCTSVVCPAHSVCKTGSCACDSGYVKTGALCVAVNMGFGNGVVAIHEVADTNGTTLYDSTSINYTITASTSNPYTFTLENFLNNSSNDVTFMISSANSDNIIADTITTNAGYIYAISGAKTGSTVQLQLLRVVTNTRYTLTYSI